MCDQSAPLFSSKAADAFLAQLRKLAGVSVRIRRLQSEVLSGEKGGV